MIGTHDLNVADMLASGQDVGVATKLFNLSAIARDVVDSQRLETLSNRVHSLDDVMHTVVHDNNTLAIVGFVRLKFGVNVDVEMFDLSEVVWSHDCPEKLTRDPVGVFIVDREEEAILGEKSSHELPVDLFVGEGHSMDVKEGLETSGAVLFAVTRFDHETYIELIHALEAFTLGIRFMT